MSEQTDTYHRRQADKSLRDTYRQMAMAAVAPSGGVIRVEQHAHVMPCEDGAFVEAQIWVPRALVER